MLAREEKGLLQVGLQQQANAQAVLAKSLTLASSHSGYDPLLYRYHADGSALTTLKCMSTQFIATVNNCLLTGNITLLVGCVLISITWLNINASLNYVHVLCMVQLS